MRHFSLTGSVATLTLGMGKTAPTAALVTPPGGVDRLTSRLPGTASTTVDIAPVAVAAKHHLTPATGAVEQTSSGLHRQLPADEHWIENPETAILTLGPCHARAGGAVPGKTVAVKAGIAPVSTALTVYRITRRLSPTASSIPIGFSNPSLALPLIPQ